MTIRTGGTGKPARPPMGMYVRPDVRRFVPSDLDKTAVRLKWVNADLIARVDVEDGSYLDACTGYPTA